MRKKTVRDIKKREIDREREKDKQREINEIEKDR